MVRIKDHRTFKIYDKPFDKKIYEKYLKHEDINNLKGLEVEIIYEWEVGNVNF